MDIKGGYIYDYELWFIDIVGSLHDIFIVWLWIDIWDINTWIFLITPGLSMDSLHPITTQPEAQSSDPVQNGKPKTKPVQSPQKTISNGWTDSYLKSNNLLSIS